MAKDNLTPAQECVKYWNDFCDSNPGVPKGFVDRMGASGLARCRKAEAAERPAASSDLLAEYGGMVWALTEEGLRVFEEGHKASGLVNDISHSGSR